MKYIIKRILIGVGIALIVGFINSCEVHALVLNPYYSFKKTNSGNGNWAGGVDTTFLTDDTEYGGVSNKFGIGFAFNGIPEDSNNYTIYGSGFVQSNYGVVVQVFGSNTRFSSSNINNLLIYTNRVAVCYTSLTSNLSTNGTITNNTSVTANFTLNGHSVFTYQCSGINGYSNYFIAVYPLSAPSNIGLLFSVSYADASIENAIIEVQKEQEKQSEIMQEQLDFMKDTSIPNDSEYNFSENNADNGVINQLVTMPITLTQSFLNGFNSSCSPYNLGNLLGSDLILPCVNPGEYLGAVWNVIDVIISGMFIFVFGKRLVKIFNDVTNMKENQIDEVFD